MSRTSLLFTIALAIVPYFVTGPVFAGGLSVICEQRLDGVPESIAEQSSNLLIQLALSQLGGPSIAPAPGSASEQYVQLMNGEFLFSQFDPRLEECGLGAGTAGLCGLVDGLNVLHGFARFAGLNTVRFVHTPVKFLRELVETGNHVVGRDARQGVPIEMLGNILAPFARKTWAIKIEATAKIITSEPIEMNDLVAQKNEIIMLGIQNGLGNSAHALVAPAVDVRRRLVAFSDPRMPNTLVTVGMRPAQDQKGRPTIQLDYRTAGPSDAYTGIVRKVVRLRYLGR